MSGRREADAVVAGVGGAESEFSGLGALGVDDAVVIVENFVDCNGYGHLRILDVGIGLGVVLEGGVVTCDCNQSRGGDEIVSRYLGNYEERIRTYQRPKYL